MTLELLDLNYCPLLWSNYRLGVVGVIGHDRALKSIQIGVPRKATAAPSEAGEDMPALLFGVTLNRRTLPAIVERPGPLNRAVTL